MDRSPGVVEHMDVRERPGCAVKSGDKPAAAHFVLLFNRKLPLHVFEILKNKENPSETRAICGLSHRLSASAAQKSLPNEGNESFGLRSIDFKFISVPLGQILIKRGDVYEHEHQ